MTSSLPSHIILQIRRDLISSVDVNHIISILKIVRETLKKSCCESKKARKDTFKLLFNQYDIFNIGSSTGRGSAT
jgi:hypothetical protein